MNIIRSTTELAMHIVRPYIKAGATVIDATCGNGHDTVALAKAMIAADSHGSDLQASDSQDSDLQGSAAKGKLLAFDIQQVAIDATRSLLEHSGISLADGDIEITLVHDSHVNMERYATAADVIVFNLGYFPGGDKSITTNVESTMTAISKALSLLKKDGVVCITMYSGHEAGACEKQAILDFARQLDSSEFHAAYVNMVNQHKNPPEVLLITRKK